jgi:hypothetical protein
LLHHSAAILTFIPASGIILPMETTQDIQDIQATPDLLDRALKLSGLVTRLFREAGWDLVVVGGSAVEFYTEGSYMSGDIDLCRRNLAPIPLRLAQDLMGRLGATGGPRSWKVAGLFVDLLGLLENESIVPCRTMYTPYGVIAVIPAELALVERSLLAFYPQPDSDARNVAKKLLAVCVSGDTPVDWAEIRRLAELPSFNIARELDQLKQEVERELTLQA